MAETKATSVRIPAELVAQITQGSESLSEAIVNQYMALSTIRANALRMVRSKFAPAEWKFMADALNGNLCEGVFRMNASMLAASIEEAALYDDLASKWEIDDMDDFVNRLSTLSAAEAEAVHRHVERYWDNHATVSLDRWSGVRRDRCDEDGDI